MDRTSVVGVRAVLVGCALASAAFARAQPVPAGLELPLGSSSAAGAILPDVAADPGGGYVVVWRWYGPVAGQRNGIAARSLDASGMPVTPTVSIHDADGPDDVAEPVIGVGPDGTTVVAWSQARSIYRDIVARRLASLGVAAAASPLGFDRAIQPDVDAAGVGRFLVAWSIDDPEHRDVMARWLGADAGPVGASFRVNETISGLHDAPAVAGRADGSVAVVWRQWTGSTSLPRARIYRAGDGPVTGEIALPLEPDRMMQTPVIAVAATPDGFVAAYPEQRENGSLITDRAVVAQPFSADGVPGPLLRVGSIDNSVDAVALAVNDHGVGIVVWTDTPYDRTGNLRAAIVDLRAGTASAAIAVNAAHDDVYAPTIAAGIDGRFLVAWEDPPKPSGSPESVRGQLLTTCGNGVVEPGEACDDGNQRSGDCCSPTCTIEPLAGACWRLAATSILHFSANVHAGDVEATCSARCRTRGSSTLVLHDDGTYRWPQGTVRCTSGSVILLPDDAGRWRAVAGRVRLHSHALAALRDALRTCTGDRLGGVRTTFGFDHQDALHGTQRITLQRPGHPPVTIEARSRLNGLQLEAGVSPSPPPPPAGVEECGDQIRLRCRRR